MPFGFFCPDCDKQLNESYRVNTIINVVTHGKPTNCAAVDTKIGQRRYYEDKHNQKNRDRVGAVAKNKQHHQDQSEKNLGYQTAHNNQDVQAKRVQAAREGRLPGHLSANSKTIERNQQEIIIKRSTILKN
jgi:hypothetical protein